MENTGIFVVVFLNHKLAEESVKSSLLKPLCRIKLRNGVMVFFYKGLVI